MFKTKRIKNVLLISILFLILSCSFSTCFTVDIKLHNNLEKIQIESTNENKGKKDKTEKSETMGKIEKMHTLLQTVNKNNFDKTEKSNKNNIKEKIKNTFHKIKNNHKNTISKNKMKLHKILKNNEEITFLNKDQRECDEITEICKLILSLFHNILL